MADLSAVVAALPGHRDVAIVGGALGAYTSETIKGFQRAWVLGPDGIAGKRTLAHGDDDDSRVVHLFHRP